MWPFTAQGERGLGAEVEEESQLAAGQCSRKWRTFLRFATLATMPDGPSPTAEPGAERPLRRDAERNRRRILDAAAEVFAERGLSATMDDVAHHAGVGVGTVYRRFPDKDELIDALFVDGIDAMAALAREGLAIEDPWEGLVWFMEQALAAQADDRGLKELLFGAVRGHGAIRHARESMAPVVIALVERARGSGLRDDVQGVDVAVIQLMLGGVLDFARDVEPDLWKRYLAIVLDGLRAQRDQATPLPVRELDEDELERAMALWRAPRR